MGTPDGLTGVGGHSLDENRFPTPARTRRVALTPPNRWIESLVIGRYRTDICGMIVARHPCALLGSGNVLEARRYCLAIEL